MKLDDDDKQELQETMDLAFELAVNTLEKIVKDKRLGNAIVNLSNQIFSYYTRIGYSREEALALTCSGLSSFNQLNKGGK